MPKCQDFGEWVANLAGTIEDKSTFSKNVSIAQKKNEILRTCWIRASVRCVDEDPDFMFDTEYEIRIFLNLFCEEFYNTLDWKEWEDNVETDQEAVDWFKKLREKIFS